MMKRHYLVHACSCSLWLASAPTGAQPAQNIADIVEEVSKTSAAGDLPGKLAAYRKMAKLLAADPSNQNLRGLFIQADLQRDIARAVYSIGADDPCPALDQGTAYLEQARAIPIGSEQAPEGEAIDNMAQRFTNERRRMGCLQPTTSGGLGDPDASLVGHYYLSGVMETGSELLLKADGRFEYYISYGAVDQIAKGRWGRVAQTVTLATDPPSTEAPLFRADEVFPWDLAAETQLREYERSQLVELVAARCPWNVATTPSLWSYDLEHPKPVGEPERAKASEAKRAAEAARDNASRIIAKAAEAGANDDMRAAADAAMNAWYTAQSKMAQAHHDANLPEPDIGSPTMPRACQLPADDSYTHIPEADWRKGVGVVIGDPARELTLSRVKVTFIFADGHHETTQTRRGGFAFVPTRNGVAVDQLAIAMPAPVNRSQTLLIKPLVEGIQAVLVDTQQIVEPAFSVMHFDVEGKDLRPQDIPRGRYSRN